ncbi:MAG TPA: SpoIIE family protein phosphatase [Streptosporangiaceae bacterium]|nr:SpoIIE family protein phosphatase [Streptosporangiaceae bacterium]
MNPKAGAASEWCLPAEMLLDQAEVGIIVTDRRSILLYVNPFAARLFQVPGDVSRFIGQSIFSIGFGDGDRYKAAELARNVLRGRPWEGTFASARDDRLSVLVRAYAVPMRHRSGAIDGIIIFARKASRDSLAERDRIGLLERIGERLGGSLELGATLRHVAEMLVPQFADHCFIDLYHGDKLIRRVQTHANGWRPPPGTWALVGEEITYPEGHFCQQAMARMETVVVEDLQDEDYPAPSAGSLRAAKEAGMVSVIASPLNARGELLGVMSLALSRLTNRTGRHYGASDRDLFGAIASRIAIAIDNAMLFEAERQTALAFQKSLLPQELPELDGLDMACRYVPAEPLETHGQGIQTQVGGDWYDVIPLAAGRVGIVIGDVEGRGPRAAAIMGQLRAALRAFAQDEKAPADILRKLDEWCRSMGPASADTGLLAGDPPTVSCTYLVYDPWSRELSFANAGHDAPLLMVDGQARQMEVRNKGVLLGVRGNGIRGLPTYKEETLVLPPDATLVLYTDGLTDRRTCADGSGHYSEEEAVDMLCRAVSAVAAGGADAIAQAAQQAVPGDIDDDMAILVVRSLPGELDARERVFPAEPVMVSEARRMALETFRAWGMDREQSELACLLVSEVVTNAVLHTSATPSPRREFGDFDAGPELLPDTAAMPIPAPAPAPAGAMAPPAPPVPWEVPVPVMGTDQGGFPGTAPKDFALRLRRGSSAIWVEVFDADMRLPRIRAAEENDEGGRGLYLVEQLAARWGSRPTRNGKAVWFEMPLNGHRPLPDAHSISTSRTKTTITPAHVRPETARPARPRNRFQK